jgi:hypothetical protein
MIWHGVIIHSNSDPTGNNLYITLSNSVRLPVSCTPSRRMTDRTRIKEPAIVPLPERKVVKDAQKGRKKEKLDLPSKVSEVNIQVGYSNLDR